MLHTAILHLVVSLCGLSEERIEMPNGLVLIAGGTGGVGRELAAHYHQRGKPVIITGRDGDRRMPSRPRSGQGSASSASTSASTSVSRTPSPLAGMPVRGIRLVTFVVSGGSA